MLLRSGWWLPLVFLALFALSCTAPPATAPTATSGTAPPATAPTAATGTSPAATAPAATAGAAPAATAPAATAPAAAAVAPAAQSAAPKGLGAVIAVSKPANGTHFVAGEQPVLTITLQDPNGKTLDRAKDFGQLRLMASGPMATTKTTTAVKLLKTTADRAKEEHHYVNLVTNAEVQVSGNVLTYKLAAVSDEKPGTYAAVVRGASKADPMQQAVALVDFQVGTATVEKSTVGKEKCAACHLGADSGKLYFAHIDPSQPGQPGSWATDQEPVGVCKTCHNNEGYAAYRSPADQNVRIPDPIVNRVHGIHMGEHLQNVLNTDPKTGIFRDYVGVIFPRNVKDCTSCHVDDAWKTQPSELACGTCHDNIWFGDESKKPATFKGHTAGSTEHLPPCEKCHLADTSSKDGKGIAPAHKITQLVNAVDVSLTAPANGKFYVAGEKPKVTLVIKNDSGEPIADHTKVDNANFSTAGLFVYGNRAKSVPVLTSTAKNGISKARASASNSIAAAGDVTKGWTFAPGDTFKIAVNGNPPVELPAPAGLQTPNQVRDWLAANLKDVTVTASATNVTIRSNLQGEKSRIEIYNSPVTKIMGWKPLGRKMANGKMTAGVTMEPYVIIGALSYPVNDLRKLSDPLDYSDPSVTRNAANITYQLDDVAGLPAGTYGIYAWVQPIAGKTPGVSRSTIGFKTFQVGTEKEELKIAGNCSSCHGDTIFHLDAGPQHPAPFNTDYCKACHDYQRYTTGDSFAALGGTSLSGWSGYGAVPIARRVHGVHFGRYLNYPEQIYAGNPDIFREAIFPQDVRNCTKCHDPKTTSAAWKEEPSRLACMACHDRPSANAHAILQTLNPTPADPWGDAKVETCELCHGAGREFSPDKAHSLTPYKPPYPREPE